MSSDVKIANRFKLYAKVGSGSFGEIYRGIFFILVHIFIIK